MNHVIFLPFKLGTSFLTRPTSISSGAKGYNRYAHREDFPDIRDRPLTYRIESYSGRPSYRKFLRRPTK